MWLLIFWQSVHDIKSSRKDYNASCTLEILKPFQYPERKRKERERERKRERESMGITLPDDLFTVRVLMLVSMGFIMSLGISALWK